MSDVVERINDYLAKGGLYNPDLMDHAKVRDLLIEVRSYLLAVQYMMPESDAEFIKHVRAFKPCEQGFHPVYPDTLKRLCDIAERTAKLETALLQAQDWFQQYGNSHINKGDLDKAKRNYERAEFCRKALEG